VAFELSYAAFRLRPLVVDDAVATMTWRNRPEIRQSMVTDHEIRLEEHTRWIGRILSDESCSYHVFEHEGRPIGSVGFYDLDRRHRRGDWTFYVGERETVRGAGGAMLFFAIDHFFDDIGLTKLCGDVISTNPRSARIHENLGFELEGVRKRHLVRGEGFIDLSLYALFAEKWRQIRRQQFVTLFK
jgi:UDP-4-amino-4,6-dideoxy-N-acetyl-beta-L-altrosamine N-acetyltransferase